MPSNFIQYTDGSSPEWVAGVLAGVDTGVAVTTDAAQSTIPLTTGRSAAPAALVVLFHPAAHNARKLLRSLLEQVWCNERMID